MKPLRETGIGKFLQDKNLGHLLEGVGDLVPGVRVLDRIKDIVLGQGNLAEEDRRQFMQLYSLELDAFNAEITDRAGARLRERDFIAASGHIDWFMTIFGLVILFCFVFTVIVSAWGDIPAEMREIFIESRAAVRDIVLAIAAYYWGSSAGSRMKELRAKN